MKGVPKTLAGSFLLSTLLSGCESLRPASEIGHAAVLAAPARPAQASSSPADVVPTSYHGPMNQGLDAAVCKHPGPTFADVTELPLDALVQQVLARNPTLPQMVAAWQAASARYPQVTSLDDPFLGVTGAPSAIGAQEIDGAYRLEISQKIPWCGKLRLRGVNALAEASAAGNEVEDVRLQLIEAAKSAFYDYYFVYRALSVNEESLRLLADFRKNAETRYQTGQAVQQDVLQVDVEMGRTRDRTLLLQKLREVAVARLNTLMHLPPDRPLPPPPQEVHVADGLPEAPALRAAALARRPDLEALRNRLAAESAALGLAYKEYFPDVDVLAAYDALWQEKPLRGQVAVRLNLPVRLARRDGAVNEAQARIAQRRAELARRADQVNYEVQQANAQVRESARVVRLYDKEVLPAARNNVKAAQAAYITGRIPFLSLIEAQRNVVNLQDRYHEAVADYFRRLATLERAVGGSLTPLPPEGEPLPPGGVR